MSQFGIVHIHNKSTQYHLTFQVLYDLKLILESESDGFFYHILSKNPNEFNKLYGSFAYIIHKSSDEADLYLNVDDLALHHIIQYVQAGKINGEKIYSTNWKIIDEIINLSTIFGMPNLVQTMRKLHPSEEKIEEFFNKIKTFSSLILSVINTLNLDFDSSACQEAIDDFILNHKSDIVDTYFKSSLYSSSPVVDEVLIFYLKTIAIPLLVSLFKKYDLFPQTNFPSTNPADKYSDFIELSEFTERAPYRKKSPNMNSDSVSTSTSATDSDPDSDIDTEELNIRLSKINTDNEITANYSAVMKELLEKNN